MSSVLDRAALEESPLADLHVIANQLGVDGFRRLRKADLIDAIIARQNGEELPTPPDGNGDEEGAAEKPARARRSSSRKRGARDADPEGADETAAAEEAAAHADDDDDEPRRERGRRGGRGGRGASRREEDREEKVVEGSVELQPNGSGFVRVDEAGPSDDDVYVSAAQVKRCELVTGDKVAGPVRAPRRSERFASLIRVDTINGRPAEEVAEGTKFEDLPATFPTERLELGGDDPTVTAIEWLAPFGKGSRVTITGATRSGKSEALRRIAKALAGREGVEVTVVLAGVRPEETSEWTEPAPTAALNFASSPESQGQAVESCVEQGRRVAARGGDAVVLIDSLEYLSPSAARRVMAAARNLSEGGSLTIIAAAPAPVGGETTVIALDQTLTALGRFPAIDLRTSGVLRPELLVGEEGAAKIAQARAEALAA